MLERLGIAILIGAAGFAVYHGLSRIWLWRNSRAAFGFPGYRQDRPAVLYFTAPGCLPCETVQRPALRDLRARWGGRLQVFEIDSTTRPDLADRWGVLGVPTTFVIDSTGRPRRVNHGVARVDRLASQLAAIGEVPADPARVPNLAAEE